MSSIASLKQEVDSKLDTINSRLVILEQENFELKLNIKELFLVIKTLQHGNKILSDKLENDFELKSMKRKLKRKFDELTLRDLCSIGNDDSDVGSESSNMHSSDIDLMFTDCSTDKTYDPQVDEEDETQEEAITEEEVETQEDEEDDPDEDDEKGEDNSTKENYEFNGDVEMLSQSMKKFEF